MDHSVHNKLVSFIWSIADDCLRDVYVRGKYRDVILPMVVLRRLDTGVFQVSCRLKLNFMPPAFLLFSQGLNLLHLSLTSLVTSLTNGLGYSI